MQERLRRVGKGQDIPDRFELEPQQWLRQSHHPYAPFTGSAYEWGSWVHDDGTMFEGLTRNSIPHGKGVMQFGVIGKGAGFAETKLGDVYEGEFHTGWAHGIGRYTTSDGLVFKGEFTAAQKDGCGAMYDLKPWKDLIAQGKDPRKAWKMAKAEIFETARYGTWRNDNFVSDPTNLGSFCSLGDIQKTLVSVDNVVNGARMFTFRPDGQATMHKMLLPESEAPAPVMQHPLHYPHGTLFMAPGPAGQTVGIPDSPTLKALMLKEYRNYMRIHERYNFDFVPAGDSLMAKVLRWGAKRDKIKQREEALEKQRADRRLRKIRGEDSGSQQSKAEPSPASSSKKDEKRDDEDDGGFDDDDLLASASAIIARQPTSGASSGVGPTAFGSITLSMSRARHGLGNFFENLAKRAPPMPRLGRDRRH